MLGQRHADRKAACQQINSRPEPAQDVRYVCQIDLARQLRHSLVGLEVLEAQQLLAPRVHLDGILTVKRLRVDGFDCRKRSRVQLNKSDKRLRRTLLCLNSLVKPAIGGQDSCFGLVYSKNKTQRASYARYVLVSHRTEVSGNACLATRNADLTLRWYQTRRSLRVSMSSLFARRSTS